MLAALPGIAAAQTISTTAGELTFSGLFTTDGPDNIPQTADDALGAPNATQNISGVGYLTGGAFIPTTSPSVGYPFSPTYRTGFGFSDERTANYTFVFDAGPGTITDPFSGVGDPSVVTEYSVGTLNIYRTPDQPGVMTNNNFADRTTFSDGNLFLSSTITFLRSSFDPRFGLGSVAGTLSFTGGELYTAFLLPNNILTGEVSSQTRLFSTTNAPGSYDFQADGRIDAAVIPEPSTYLLMGTGLLGLAGFARRRRA
jgi:hypothetical protein